MSKLTLNALFDYVNSDGIFTYLNSFDVPWKNDVDVDVLDLDYHSKYGTRVVSKTVTSLLTTDGLSAANKAKLAKLIYHKNKVKWDELWDSMGLYDEFNPLDNTNWTESETIQHSGQDAKTQNIGAKQNSYTKGSQSNSSTQGAQTFTEGGHTDTIGQQSNTTGAQTVGMEEKRSAYNSSNYQPNVKKDESIGQRSDTIGQRSDIFGSKENSQSARSDSYTEGQRSDTSTEGAQQNSESGTNSFTDIHTVTKSGNIGVTSSGELIRDFRKTVDWQFFEYVYEDINDALVIEVYGREDDDFDDYTIVTAYQLPIASATKLGGIKVGTNLQIASDGTLSAVIESGVDSVNGKTGVVVLVPNDIGAAAASDLTTLAGTVESQGQAITNIRQVPANGSTGQAVRKTSDGYDWGNIREVPENGSTGQAVKKTADGYDWGDIKEVPAGGTNHQVLTKGSGDTYSWQDAQGGSGITLEHTLLSGSIWNSNGLATWDRESSKPNTKCFCFDVGAYVGKKVDCYFVPKGSQACLDRHRFAFYPSTMDFTQYSSSGIAGSYFLGCTNDAMFYGKQLVDVSGYGFQNNTTNQRHWFQYTFNHFIGIIPEGIKYLLVQPYGEPTSDDFYTNNVECVCKIFNS